MSTDKQNNKKSVPIIVGIVSVIILIGSFIGIRALIGSLSKSDTDSPSSFLSSEEVTPYVSSQHGFSVDFPGFPEAENTLQDIEGVPVPFTQYSKELEKGNKAYLVQVVEYPLSNFDLSGRERGSLDGAINGMAQGSGFTIVSSSNDGTFLGYPSAEVKLIGTSDGKEYDMYALNFIKGNSLYTITGVGLDKPEFDKFVNSFKLN